MNIVINPNNLLGSLLFDDRFERWGTVSQMASLPEDYKLGQPCVWLVFCSRELAVFGFMAYGSSPTYLFNVIGHEDLLYTKDRDLSKLWVECLGDLCG